ncbi:hypothetical protein GCM10011405_27360 [Rufibacter glacialis]|uniref:YqaE/Pmp3 family membrane protein n=1 Tax=Rufibacter glacialis TaxID=1259555 RepID=UPI00198EBECC|nr:YqaE/Pmp3 family membrane protein [Rufibacter glacialis]GGK78098.1 hypothetical protein GCM10011405_27360 [Rufibacter glacialis]
MKFKSLLQFVLVVLAGQFLFSCSSTEYYRFASVKPETYQRAIAKTEPVQAPAETVVPAQAVPVVTVTPSPTVAKKAEPVLEASAKKAQPVLLETKKVAGNLPEAKVTQPVQKLEANTALEAAKTRLAHMTKAEKKEFRKEMRHALRETNALSDIVMIVLAILLPPLAVFLHEGLGSRFWISILLTLLFFIPGVIFALLVVTDSI